MADQDVEAALDSKAYFRRLERLEQDLNVLFEKQETRDMRNTLKYVFAICAVLVFGTAIVRPVYWSYSTRYGSKQYHSVPADEEPPPSIAPLYSGESDPNPGVSYLTVDTLMQQPGLVLSEPVAEDSVALGDMDTAVELSVDETDSQLSDSSAVVEGGLDEGKVGGNVEVNVGEDGAEVAVEGVAEGGGDGSEITDSSDDGSGAVGEGSGAVTDAVLDDIGNDGVHIAQ